MTNPPSATFWSGLFGRLAESAQARPKTWLLAGALLCLAALALASTRLELKTSNLDLVDHDIPTVARFLSFAERFGSPNMLVVVLEGKDEAALREAVDRIAPRLVGAPGVRTVLGRLPYDPARLAELNTEAYFASRDHGMYFVFVQPDDPNSSATTIAPFVEGVKRVVAEARLGQLGVTAGLTGLPQYALDDRDIIQRDISWLSTLSFGVVLLIFVVGFHSVRRPLLTMLALLGVALIVTGVAAIVPGHLTLLSAFFFSALFGLGSDYGVYILHGMEELMAEGQDRATALVNSVRLIAPGLATAAYSTAASFLVLTASGFKGFAELGLIGAIGIVLSLVAMLTLLPALLAVTGDRARGEKPIHARHPGRIMLRLQIPALAIALGVAALAVSLAGLPPFDGDYTHLQPEHSEAVRLERQMVERSPLSPQFAAFVAKDRDAAADVIAQLLEQKSVGAVRSRHDLVQLDAAAIPEPAARAAYERLFRADDGSLAVYAYPAGNIWDPAFEKEFLAAVTAIDPNVTGMPVLGRFMIDLSQRALLVSGLLSVLVVVLLVALEFGLTRYTILAALPTLLGVAATVGTMRLAGLPFNPLNVMAFPVIVGTAVDAGVHLTQRFLAERGDLPRTIAGAGHTVLISGLTTVVGFGALAFTAHRGLASFAIVLTIGTSLALTLSLLTLPLLLVWASRRAPWRRGATAAALALLALSASPPASAAPAEPGALARGAAAWRDRGRGFATTGVVDPQPVGEAIEAFRAAMAAAPDDPLPRWNLVEALYFRGHFAPAGERAARDDFDAMVEVSEEGVARAAPGSEAAAEAHFWAAVSWGLWGPAHGNVTSALRDVARKIRDHAAAVIAIDERWRDAGGLRLAGRLNTKVPKVPLVSGWADRTAGIEQLRRAVAISTADLRNQLFLGEALLEYRPDRREEAIALLCAVACVRPDGEAVVELSEQVAQARERLAREKVPFDPGRCEGDRP